CVDLRDELARTALNPEVERLGERAAPAVRHDLEPSVLRGHVPSELNRAVGRAPVDEHDADELPRVVLPEYVLETALDVALLVQRRDDDVDPHEPIGSRRFATRRLS